jgi:hypothetical protein
MISPILKNLWNAAFVPSTLLEPLETSIVPVPVTSPDRFPEINSWIPVPVPEIVIMFVLSRASCSEGASLKLLLSTRTA